MLVQFLRLTPVNQEVDPKARGRREWLVKNNIYCNRDGGWGTRKREGVLRAEWGGIQGVPWGGVWEQGWAVVAPEWVNEEALGKTGEQKSVTNKSQYKNKYKILRSRSRRPIYHMEMLKSSGNESQVRPGFKSLSGLLIGCRCAREWSDSLRGKTPLRPACHRENQHTGSGLCKIIGDDQQRLKILQNKLDKNITITHRLYIKMDGMKTSGSGSPPN